MSGFTRWLGEKKKNLDPCNCGVASALMDEHSPDCAWIESGRRLWDEYRGEIVENT